MALRLSLFFIAFAVSSQAAVIKDGVVVPTYATVCRRSQPDIDDCLKNSIQTLIQKISRDGIRELDLPPLDPWRIEKVNMNYGAGTPIKVSMQTSDSNTYGFSRLQFHKVRTNFEDPKKISMEIDFSNKKIYIEGNYKAEGVISDVPVIASGKFNVSLTNVTGTFKLNGHLIKKADGQEYLQVDRATMRPVVGDAKIHMTNDNNKYPELHELFLTLMNQFWRVMYEELLPYAEENFSQVMTPRINLVALKIPFDQLIPK